MGRLDRILAALLFLLALVITIYTYPEQAGAVLTLCIFSIIALIFIRHFTEDFIFLQRLFTIGLLLRVSLGLFTHIYDLREFFGGDANTYHMLGTRLYEIWFEGVFTNDPFSQEALSMTIPGWGMHWFIAILYTFTGPNILAAQFFCNVIGAATVPLLYTCALKIFNNRQTAKISAIGVAVFPAFVMWSSQLLKDGLLVFLLVLSITMVLKLQEKFDYKALLLLIGALFAITSMRFYLFYMLAVAIVGSFVIGSAKSEQSIIKRLIICILVGTALALLSGGNIAKGVEEYGNLDRIQNSRKWSAQVSESGYGKDLDVSTPGGVFSTLPIGFAYLMFAPFPWEASNLRQAIALPETFLWWSCLPLLFMGFKYTLKHRLRNSIAVILFTVLLTLSYSITQSNVGTAYRQRTQIQVFLFMFIAVGWQLRKEKKENEIIESRIKKQILREKIQRLAN